MIPNPQQVKISNHAKLRYLQRIDSNEITPSGPIVEAVHDGVVIDDPDVEADNLRAVRGNGLTVVMSRSLDRVVTVLPQVSANV